MHIAVAQWQLPALMQASRLFSMISWTCNHNYSLNVSGLCSWRLQENPSDARNGRTKPPPARSQCLTSTLPKAWGQQADQCSMLYQQGKFQSSPSAMLISNSSLSYSTVSERGTATRLERLRWNGWLTKWSEISKKWDKHSPSIQKLPNIFHRTFKK